MLSNFSSKKIIYVLAWIISVCTIYYTNLFMDLTMEQLKFFLLIFGVLLFRNNLTKEIQNDKHSRVVVTGIFVAIFILLVSYVYQSLIFDHVKLGFSKNSLEVTSLLNILLLAPLFEELTYRYAMISVANSSMLSYTSIVISAVLFAYSHRFVVSGNVLLLVPYFLMGLILAMLYFKKKNILYALYTHFFYNLIVVLISIFINQ